LAAAHPVVERIGGHRGKVARSGPAGERPGQPRDPATLRQQPRAERRDAARRMKQPRAAGSGPERPESAPDPGWSAPFGHTLRAQRQQHAWDVDAHGADLATRTAQAARVRQVTPLLLAPQCGCQHRADRAGIDAAVGVSANLLIDRTDVQARAAADAVENLRLAAAEHLRSAVVDEHYVQFVRTVGLTD